MCVHVVNMRITSIPIVHISVTIVTRFPRFPGFCGMMCPVSSVVFFRVEGVGSQRWCVFDAASSFCGDDVIVVVVVVVVVVWVVVVWWGCREGGLGVHPTQT